MDDARQNFNINSILNISLNESIEKANYNTKRFPTYFTAIRSIKWIVIDSDDLVKKNLVDCEKILTDFVLLLGLNISQPKLKDTIEYDSHQFIEDSTWWDQSNVAEYISSMSIPARSSNFTYLNDFYYLHGNRSFVQYLIDNRQCYNDGIFVQMQSETILKRNSTGKLDRCISKPFDCAFSDLYSFQDREQLYQQSNSKPIKCGFAISSIFDKIRNRYSRNHTCQTIIFICIINCYDPLPQVKGTILPSFCFVALVDTRTLASYKRTNANTSHFQWDLIDLGVDAAPFSVAAKSAETTKIVGHRMFPLAKWIIWLDGKARINDITKILKQANAPVIGAHHPDYLRTSASEVNPTINRIHLREKLWSQRFNNSIADIQIQEKAYQSDGFYSRSEKLKLKMYDIAVFLYRNHQPCIFRYLCGWHNEVNYFSYRGQLSVYYAAVRLNLTDYLHFLPSKFYSTVGHRRVC